MAALCVLIFFAFTVLVFVAGMTFGFSLGWFARARSEDRLAELDRQIADIDRQLTDSET